jgi:ribonuclease E
LRKLTRFDQLENSQHFQLSPFFQAQRLREQEDTATRQKTAELKAAAKSDKADPIKEKKAEKEKALEAKPQAPPRPLQRAIVGAGGKGAAKNEGPTTASRVETMKKFSEQFQLSFGKQETVRTAPQVPPPPGQTTTPVAAQPQAQAAQLTQRIDTKEATETRAATKSEAGKKEEVAKVETVRAEKPERILNHVEKPAEKGEDWTGMRRSTGFQQVKQEMDTRQQHSAAPQRETPTQEKTETRQAQQNSGSSSGGERDQQKGQERQGEQHKDQQRERQRDDHHHRHERGERPDRDQQQQQQQRRPQQEEAAPQQETEKNEAEHQAQREEAGKTQSCNQCGGALVGIGICPTCSRPGR